MATKKEKQARPAPRRGVSAAARAGHGSGEGDLPLDYETAVRNNAWGWWWASVASVSGAAAAAAFPLPARLEAEARDMAGRITVSPAALAEPFAKFPTVAEDAYRAALVIAQKVRRVRSPTPELLREADEAVQRAEVRGREAALIARFTLLAVGVAAARDAALKVRL